MDEKETIARLRDHFSVHDDGRPTPKLNEAVSIVIKATKKQIAKKMSIGNDNGRQRKSCGNCGCFVLPSSNYCSKCGQKLDWSDV